MAQIDDVMKHDAAVAMHRGNHFRRRPQAGNDDGDFVFHAQRDILLQAIVAAVHDLIHRERRHLQLRVRALICRQFLA